MLVETSPGMRNETAIASLATIGLAVSTAVALHQTGVIDRLPDISWRGFDANAVTRSRAAFPLGIPDAIPASALYAAELAAERTHAAGQRDKTLQKCRSRPF